MKRKEVTRWSNMFQPWVRGDDNFRNRVKAAAAMNGQDMADFIADAIAARVEEVFAAEGVSGSAQSVEDAISKELRAS